MKIIGAVVLCGGRSRRMGRPKERLTLGGETLLERVVRLVAERASPVVVSVAVGQELPPLPHPVEIVRDPEPDGGPLVGLRAGLDALVGRAEWAFATATDAPFLEPRWIDRLRDHAEGVELVLPDIDGRDHPLAALYRVRPASIAADRLLGEGRRRLVDLAGELRTRRLSADVLRAVDPGLETLRNVNRPEEYDAAVRELGGP